MKQSRIIPAIVFAATLVCGLIWATEVDRRFLRSEGSISLSDATVHTVINASKGTNAHPLVKVTWKAGGVTDGASQLMKQAGWFVFAEQPTRIWVFNGDDLSLVEKKDKTVGNSNVSISTSSEPFKNCPRQVKEALPEHLRRKMSLKE